MRRVLILGLYYPPANFMAGRRLEGWARHLPAYGYEPLVLTRFYDPEERHTHDFYAAGRATRTLQTPWLEENGVVYTRFEPSRWSRAPVPGKVRGLVHYAWPDPDHSVWLRWCREYLERADFRPDLIVGSYSPPGVLRVAHKLAEWLGVPWVADFRDLWLDEADDSLDSRVKIFFQRRHLRTAAGVTVVSDATADELRRQLAPMEKPVRIIYNGAEPPDGVRPDAGDRHALELFESLRRAPLLLTYAGMLYPEQETAPFLDAVAEFNRRAGGQTCAVALCGRHEPEKFSRWPFVRVLGPVAHPTAMYMLTKSTALFYPAWPGRYTGFSGKFFEQVVSGRPVLIAFRPSPDMEEFARRFDSVTVAHEPEELIGALGRLMREGDRVSRVPEVVTKKYWAGELAKFFDEILERSGAARTNGAR